MHKVAYISNESEIIGGGELSFIDLVDTIRTHAVDPVVFVPAEGEVSRRIRALEIPVVVFPWPGLKSISSIACFPGRVRTLAGIFRHLQVDLVHVNGARAMLYAGAAARLARIPCVWHVRVIERDRVLDFFRAHLASVIIANSRAVADSLVYVASVAKRKTTVIYNGLDIERIKNLPVKDARSEFELGPAPLIMGIGRFTRWKGFDDLLRACALLKEKGIDFSCLLVGEALPGEKDYESELKSLTVDLGLSSVRFAGWREDALSLLKSADLLVVPSHHEPFGRVVIEAWACGVPVVATDSGGPAEIIADGTDGILVPVGGINEMASAMTELVTDRKKRLALSNSGSQAVRKFSIAEHLSQVVKVYSRINPK